MLFVTISSCLMLLFSVVISAQLMLNPSEEHRLKKLIRLIFIDPDLSEIVLESSADSNMASQNLNKRNTDTNCECPSAKGIRIAEAVLADNNINSCCKADPEILFPKLAPNGCGIQNEYGIGPRISKTEGAQFGEFPWMALVFTKIYNILINRTISKYICGGSIIHPKVVLTAAHCVYKPNVQFFIRAGEWDIENTSELYPHQDRQVGEVIIHFQYDNISLNNDIALLIVKEPLIFTVNVQPICLPNQDEILKDSTSCVASGWGRDVFQMQYQSIMKKIGIPIVSRSVCESQLRTTILGKGFFLVPSFICAGGKTKEDTCQGDGGSPLVCPIPSDPDRYYQGGIVSWGIGCGDSNIPAVYVNVPLFRNWIDLEMTRLALGTSSYTV